MSSIDQEINQLASSIDNAKSQIERESKFVEQANKQFEANLLAFKYYFPDIYERFVSYQPTDKFNLFVNNNGSGNITDTKLNVPFYSEDPTLQSQKQVDDAIALPEVCRVDQSVIEHLSNETNFVHVDLLKSIGVVYNKAKSELPPNNKLDDVIPSVIIFGVGLGYHLSYLNEQVKASYINIFEPNEDYFFGSLFCFDWANYLKRIDDQGSALYIGIGVPEEELYEELYRRAQYLGAFSISNSFFYQHYPSQEVNELIEKIKINFHQFFMGWGFFDDALMSIAHTLENTQKDINLLVQHDKLPTEIEKFPIFILANGPSLDKDIEVIRAMKDEVVLVSCNSATTALLKQGIIPDFHVALERTKATADFLTAFITPEQRKKIGLITVNVMYPEVPELFGWCGVGFKGNEPGTSIYHIAEYIKTQKITTTVGYCNPLVGNTALSFFASKKFKEIYLFGVDNGYVDPNHHHSKASYYYNDKGSTIHNPLKMGNEMVVEGNFGKKVITDHFMYTGKEQMERLLESFKGTHLNCYNCSDGTKIEGALPLHSSDILLDQQPTTKQHVIQFIKQECYKPFDKSIDAKEYLDFDIFESICSSMVEILEQSMDSREQALENLLASLRFLYSFKQEARYAHLYLILEGECLYTSSILLSALYNFGTSEEALPYYSDALVLWIDFLKQAPTYYRERWNQLSDYSFDYSKPSVENVEN